VIEIAAPALRWVGHARVEGAPPVPLGTGPLGDRRMVPLRAGQVTGAWNGVVLEGGADWQCVHSDGSVTLAARYPVRLDDDCTVCFVARGTRREEAADGRFATSLLLEGETADDSAATVFVAEGRKVERAVEFNIFEVVDSTAPDRTMSKVLTIDVSLLPPVMLSQSSGGRRTFIPIVGGSISGRLDAEIIAGGGDWAVEKADESMTIHAHYLVRGANGEVIEVENTGRWRERPGLLPYFVTAPVFTVADGTHTWLRTGVFIGMAHEVDDTRVVIDVYAVDLRAFAEVSG
jgi:hypothetical protein